MIRDFLRERRSWLLLLLGIQLLLLLLAYVDSAIPFLPVLYAVGLNTFLCMGFVIVRYVRETSFYRELDAWDHAYDLTGLQGASSPLEQKVLSAITRQGEHFRRETDEHFLLLEQEKDDMLAWTHEMKTPLTALKLMIERLPEEALKQQMMYEWLRIHYLLDRQLHQKRIPFMEKDLYFEQLDLEAILHAEIKALQSWCIRKGIGFDLMLEATAVVSDAKWTAFIVRQLLTNAVKYNREGSDVEIRSSEAEGHLTLSIKDAGEGIAARDLPRIFEKGFTSTQNHQSSAATGMGLYLAKQAAASLSIQLKAASVPGDGSTFTLIFPRENELQRLTGK